ncbi:MAG TPA: twin-arginine translocase TatA/TatE family subunit [Deltaproteobacteria bacterium]|nr:twin-arginine translocase TatA/TatE family subunit [Deltaproteobacteria bacterium]HCP45034.1 twin-arginine translocase TatA/TatE family subunit [Deltaproteobacteria bacterium]
MIPLGTTELIIILVIIMMFFGVGKLPEVAKALGKSFQAFKEGQKAPPIDVTPSTDELPAPPIEASVAEGVGQVAMSPSPDSD